MKTIKQIYKESSDELSKTSNGRAMLACISCLEDDIEKARNLLLEADEYLDTNNLTSIGHGSILHDKFHLVGNEI